MAQMILLSLHKLMALVASNCRVHSYLLWPEVSFCLLFGVKGGSLRESLNLSDRVCLTCSIIIRVAIVLIHRVRRGNPPEMSILVLLGDFSVGERVF